MAKTLIDTNIIVRYYVDNDTTLLKLIDSYDELVIPISVVFESVFVLEKLYKVERDLISKHITSLIQEEKVDTDLAAISKTIEFFKVKHNLNIIDCYLLALALQQNMDLQTMDKELEKTHNLK